MEHKMGEAPYILIYQDFIENNFPLYRSLCESWGRAAVDWCTADDILSGRLAPPVRLLVMPGGEDLYYSEKLNGAGNRAIRRFVENGGRYLGICGGAYYASAALEWARGTEYEISGPRELGFFPGTAIGPVGGGDALDDEGNPLPCLVDIAFDSPEKDISTVQALYYGGPVFTDAPPVSEDYRVLGRWTGSSAVHDTPRDPAAILKIRVGKGFAILSAIHPEIGAKDLKSVAYETNHSAQILIPLAHTMQDKGIERGRQALWDHIQHHLDIGEPEP